MNAREILDHIKIRGRYMASSTREERAQFRADHTRMSAAVEATLAILDQADEDRRVIQDNKPTARIAAALVEVDEIRAAIEYALNS